MIRSAWLGLLLSSPLGAQQIVEFSAYDGTWALGYPVPEPVESLTPVAGFRSLASLQARHQSLYFQSPWVTARVIGQSHEGRDIWAYTVSDADSLTRGGLAEPAALFSAAIHAREWQAPEALSGLFESLVESADDQSLGQFLVENLQIELLPVLNPDGLAHTQRYPHHTVYSLNDTRDGRLRRKNLRDTDGQLETLGDYLLGVDLNRQFPPFWGNGGSSSPAAITYRGPEALSEPEAMALVAALDSDTATRLRLYADFHSFGKVFIVPQTNRPALDNLSNALVGHLQAHLAALGNQYAAQYWPQSAGIGATDEHYAETYGVPAWTFEIEPRVSASEYQGWGLKNDGFILPETEIQRVREEVDSTYRLALYHQYGPPVLQAVQIHRADTLQVVFAAHWQRRGDSRQLLVEQDGPLSAGQSYLLWLGFDKPMRHRLNDTLSNYPGQTVNLAPQISLLYTQGEIPLTVSEAHWLQQPGGAPRGYQHYRDDALAVPFTAPAQSLPDDTPGLRVSASDMVGLQLDAEPGSPVGFNAGWNNYQPGSDENIIINASSVILRSDFER